MTSDMLRGVRVLEIGDSLAGAYATKLLLDLGAEVTLVRDMGADLDGAPGTRAAADCPGLESHLDAGKRTVTDPPTELGALMRASDVVVESLGAAGLEKAGIAIDSLRARHPALSVIRISPFGQTGPYRDRPWTDLTLQAASGWVNQHGTAGYPPFRVGGNVHHYAVGAYAALYAMTAISAVDAGLGGSDVDLSMMEAIHSALPYPRLSATYVEGNRDRLSTVRQYPFGIHRCRDGWVGLNTLTGQHWQDACVLTEVADHIDRYEEIKRDGELFARFRSRVDAWMSARDVVEVVEIAQAFRIPAVPVGEGHSVLDVPQWQARPFFVEGELDGRPGPRPGPAWRIGAGREPRPGSPAPDRTADDGMALRGLRVLELGTFWAAPYLTCYLGAAGADVIKIESTRRPDGFRYLSTGAPGRADWYERSGMWQATNLNKRDLTLDLTDARGRELFRELLRSADVVVENFAVRVFEQLGLDEEQLLAENPGLVILRMPGYGLEGPARDHVGWGNAFEQLAGIAAITGFPGEPPQTPGGYLDPIVGVHAGVAMLAALHGRQRGDGGRSIEVAQIEVGAAVCPEPLLRHVLDGAPTPRVGNASGKAAPEVVLPVTGCNGWIALSVRTDDEWSALVRLLGAPAWASAAELETMAGRLARATEIEGRLAEWSESRDGAELVAELLARGIAAAEVLAPRGFYDDAQLAHRGYFGEVDHPVTGPRTYPGWPGRTTLLPGRHHRGSAPLLGQHNREILQGELGLAAADTDELEASGVIGTVPRGVDRDQSTERRRTR